MIGKEKKKRKNNQRFHSLSVLALFNLLMYKQPKEQVHHLYSSNLH